MEQINKQLEAAGLKNTSWSVTSGLSGEVQSSMNDGELKVEGKALAVEKGVELEDIQNALDLYHEGLSYSFPQIAAKTGTVPHDLKATSYVVNNSVKTHFESKAYDLNMPASSETDWRLNRVFANLDQAVDATLDTAKIAERKAQKTESETEAALSNPWLLGVLSQHRRDVAERYGQGAENHRGSREEDER